MDALSIVVTSNLGEQVTPGLILGRPSALVDEFDREGVEEALHRSVIAAAAGAAHKSTCRWSARWSSSTGACA